MNKQRDMRWEVKTQRKLSLFLSDSALRDKINNYHFHQDEKSSFLALFGLFSHLKPLLHTCVFIILPYLSTIWFEAPKACRKWFLKKSG